MPDLNGMDFVKSLAAPPLIVFTTAYSEYAVEGFQVNAVDYLLKPFGLDEFKRAANRLKERTSPPALPQGEGASATTVRSALPLGSSKNSQLSTLNSEDDTIFLKTDYKVVKIAISDIRYIEGMSEYLKVHLRSSQKPIITLLSMKKIEEFLPSYFMRIHRSYIINLKEIQEINKNRVIMDAETYLPIGDNYKDTFNNYLNTKFLGK
jgi:DNA-binding LytR/AlgR family response regulator